MQVIGLIVVRPLQKQFLVSKNYQQENRIMSKFCQIIKCQDFKQEKIYGPKVCSYEIPEERAVTIDSYYDLKLAKYMMDEN